MKEGHREGEEGNAVRGGRQWVAGGRSKGGRCRCVKVCAVLAVMEESNEGTSSHRETRVGNRGGGRRCVAGGKTADEEEEEGSEEERKQKAWELCNDRSREDRRKWKKKGVK